MASVKKILRQSRFLCLGFVAALAACQTMPTDPGRDRYLQIAAETAEAQRDHRTAAAYYRTLAAERPDDPDLTLALARNLRKAGVPDQGIAVLEAALKRSGPQVGLLVELGKQYVVAARAEAALAPLEQAVALAPQDAGAHHALAIAYDHVGRFEDAAVHYETALAAAPGDAALLNNYALSNALAGRLDRARTLLGLAAALPEAPDRVRTNLALVTAISQVAGAAAPPVGGPRPLIPGPAPAPEQP